MAQVADKTDRTAGRSGGNGGPAASAAASPARARGASLARIPEFLSQVRAETAKVVWPTRKETVTTAIMVVIMTVILGLFFFGVDSVFSAVVQGLLKLLG